MWFFLAALGYFLLGIVLTLDKFILSKSIGRPVVYAFYSTVVLLIAALFVPFGVHTLVGLDWFVAVLSGFGFGLGVWTMYVAVKHGEATHIFPFNGAVIAVTVYGISRFLLGEQLDALQSFAVVVLICAAILLSFEKMRRQTVNMMAFFWAAVSGVCFGISLTASKYLYASYDFFSVFVWCQLMIGVFGIVLLLSPQVRAVFKKHHKVEKTIAKRHSFGLVLVDKILSAAAALLIQYSIAIGSVTVVGALGGTQYIWMFVIIFFLTKTFPRVLKEYFTKRELMTEVVALVLMLIGSILLVL